MKRLPLLMTFLALAAFSASLAYWSLQLIKAPQRPIVAAPVAGMAEPAADAANGLFGGQAMVALVSNFQLKGVVAPRAGMGGVAILLADGKPPQAVPVGYEIAPGVTLKEVHPKHVLLSEGGVIKRVELASDTNAGATNAGDSNAGATNVGAQAEPGTAPAPAPAVPQNQGQAQAPVPMRPQAPARMTVGPTVTVPPPAVGNGNRPSP